MKQIDQLQFCETAGIAEFSTEERVRKPVFNSRSIACDIVCFEPGQDAPMHRHPVQNEMIYILEGSATIVFEERDDIPVKQGSAVLVPAGLVHGVNTTPGERLVVMLTKGPGVADKTARSFMEEG